MAVCGYANASNTTLNHTPCCALRNNAAYSDSPANAATFGITLLVANSGPLIGMSLTCLLIRQVEQAARY
jgi:hypothetical protein